MLNLVTIFGENVAISNDGAPTITSIWLILQIRPLPTGPLTLEQLRRLLNKRGYAQPVTQPLLDRINTILANRANQVPPQPQPNVQPTPAVPPNDKQNNNKNNNDEEEEPPSNTTPKAIKLAYESWQRRLQTQRTESTQQKQQPLKPPTQPTTQMGESYEPYLSTKI